MKTILAAEDAVPRHILEMANETAAINNAEVEMLRERRDRILHLRELSSRAADRVSKLDQEISENET